MKLAIILLLVGIVSVSCLPKRGGGRRGGGGRGARKACGGRDNIATCECADGETYDNADDLKENCGRRNENPLVSCTCANGDVWTKPEREDRPEKKDRPCGKGRNIESCVCADGETYEGRDVRRNCKKRDDNLPTECTCKDGSQWPSEEEEEEEEDAEEFED